MENAIEINMENEMESGIIWGFVGLIVKILLGFVGLFGKYGVTICQDFSIEVKFFVYELRVKKLTSCDVDLPRLAIRRERTYFQTSGTCIRTVLRLLKFEAPAWCWGLQSVRNRLFSLAQGFMFLRPQPDNTPSTTLLLHWEHWDASPSTPVSPFCPFYNIGVSLSNLNIRKRAALII